MIGWLLRLFGFGRNDKRHPAPGGQRGRGPSGSNAAVSSRAARPAKAAAPAAETLTPEQFKAARRRVVLYISRARVPVRQAATTRQLWIADLSKVYEAIRTSPTEMILERAGDVGMKHEEEFRAALSLAQSIEPPPECEEVHQSLIGWLTHLHSACLALMDARRLKDRSMLGTFRERLGQARRHATTLAGLRNQLFADYRLRVDPTIRRKKEGEEQAQQQAEPEPAEKQPVPMRRPPSRRGRPVRRAGARPPAAGTRPPVARPPATRPRQLPPQQRRAAG